MVQIYCGDGKGKTTAGIGLCVRATGNDIPVLFVQFLKDTSSGELKILKMLPNVDIMHSDKFFGFTWNMTEEQKAELKQAYIGIINQVEKWINKKIIFDNNDISDEKSEKKVSGEASNTDKIKAMVILDEVIPAINCKIIEESVLFKLMDKYKNSRVEFIFTGRNPSEKLKEKADYISCIEAVRHPYEKGLTARMGVEY